MRTIISSFSLATALALTAHRAVAAPAVSNRGETASSAAFNVGAGQRVAGSFLTGAEAMTLDSVDLLGRRATVRGLPGPSGPGQR